METMLPWLLTTIFAIATIVAFLVLRSARTRHRRAMERERDERATSLAAAASAHHAELAAERQRRDAAESIAESARGALSRGIKWEAASRSLLVDACDRVGLDAVVATNATFVPLDAPAARPFVTQIDHVILTSTFVLMVESKRWQGVVLDGVAPQDVSPDLAMLVGALELTVPYVVHLQPKGAGTFEMRVAEGSKAPQGQVRKQAWRFARFVESRVGAATYVHTMVLYSHPHARVHHAASADTFVAADGRQLDAALRQLSRVQSKRGAASLLEPIAVQLEASGADLVGTGAHAQRWVSPLPLTSPAEVQRSDAR